MELGDIDQNMVDAEDWLTACCTAVKLPKDAEGVTALEIILI